MEYGVLGFVPGFGEDEQSVDEVKFASAVTMQNPVVYGIRWMAIDKEHPMPVFMVDNVEPLFRYILGWGESPEKIFSLYADQQSGDKFRMIFTVRIEVIAEKFRNSGVEIGPEDRVVVVNKYLGFEGKASENAKRFFGASTSPVGFLDAKILLEAKSDDKVTVYRIEDIPVSYDMTDFPESPVVTMQTPKSEAN